MNAARKPSSSNKLGQSVAALAGSKPAQSPARKAIEEMEIEEPTPVSTPTQEFASPQRHVKVSSTYRLPVEALDALDAAQFYAKQRGERLTKEEAVAQAILAYWTNKRALTGK